MKIIIDNWINGLSEIQILNLVKNFMSDKQKNNPLERQFATYGTFGIVLLGNETLNTPLQITRYARKTKNSPIKIKIEKHIAII